MQVYIRPDHTIDWYLQWGFSAKFKWSCCAWVVCVECSVVGSKKPIVPPYTVSPWPDAAAGSFLLASWVQPVLHVNSLPIVSYTDTLNITKPRVREDTSRTITNKRSSIAGPEVRANHMLCHCKTAYSFIIQFASILTICLLSDAIPTGDWSVRSGVVAMAYLTQAALAKIVNMAAERTGSVLYACLAQLKMNTHFLFAAPHTVTYVSSTATFSIRLHLQ